ncbi:hypothetical protein B857_03866 [Solibacillus isronensis B3W22]|uniref:DUF4179 domain-containing protein n=1 Tax=Solibacillus isronensis B3W22 TaxID=1224748 RepID=K1KLL2_9BACL|nr:DUF4179 domain-containing protein [Solibacillus isronensis]AMO85344.1 xanthosine triphosphate pyrophosphatase [Solibacillus silvestris]EKB43326.1 hypothetical protein B857_03866 [Solibacillus isronensis B3W22]
MRKDLHEIEVPTDEVFQAIHLGIEQAQQLEIKAKRTKVTKRMTCFTSVAAALFLASGFIFTPVSNVLAQVPLIGGIYEKYQMSIGEQIAHEQLLTEMSLIANDQDIQVEVTSVFYDTAYVGITFKATGAVTNTIGGDTAPEAGFTYEMFDGKDTSTWGGALGSLTKTENGYTGALILDVPANVTEDVISFPITFTHMAGVRGEWSFDLAVEKLPIKQLIINQQVTSKNRELSITFDEIQIGRTNARISYTANFESTIEGQTYTFEAYNFHGEKVNFNQISNATLLLELPKDTTSIKIVPVLKINSAKTEQLKPITIDLN